MIHKILIVTYERRIDYLEGYLISFDVIGQKIKSVELLLLINPKNVTYPIIYYPLDVLEIDNNTLILRYNMGSFKGIIECSNTSKYVMWILILYN